MDTPDDTQLDRIEAYLLGELPVPERQQLEEEMDADPDLKTQMDAARTLKAELAALEQEEFMGNLRTVQAELNTAPDLEDDSPQEEEEKTRIFRSPKWYLGLAAVILLLVVPLYFVMRPPLHQRMFNDYFEAYPNVVTTRGDEEASKQQAMEAYEAGEFANSIPQFEAYLKVVPLDSEMVFFSGVAHLANNQAEEAIGLFSSVENKNFLFFIQVEWYLSLAYIKADRLTSARPLLESLTTYPNSYRDKAKELLASLPEPENTTP